MLVNNETGVRQPLAEIAALVRERAPACRRAHRRGAGAAVARPRARAAAASTSSRSPGTSSAGRRVSARSSCATARELVPLVEGGGHERDLRAGTQNVAGIVAFATALRITHERRAEEVARIAALRDRLERGLRDAGAGFSVNGDRRRRGCRASCTAAFPASRPRRCSSRSTSRGLRRVGFGVQLGRRSTRRTCCSRWACRASARCRRSGSRLGYASTAADIDEALAGHSRSRGEAAGDADGTASW